MRIREVVREEELQKTSDLKEFLKLGNQIWSYDRHDLAMNVLRFFDYGIFPFDQDIYNLAYHVAYDMTPDFLDGGLNEKVRTLWSELQNQVDRDLLEKRCFDIQFESLFTRMELIQEERRYLEV